MWGTQVCLRDGFNPVSSKTSFFRHIYSLKRHGLLMTISGLSLAVLHSVFLLPAALMACRQASVNHSCQVAQAGFEYRRRHRLHRTVTTWKSTHRYVFTLYAVDAMLIPPSPVNRKQLLQAMEGHILATGQLTGLYHR